MMSARERILAIRLMEKLAKRSDYATRLGVNTALVKADSEEKRL